MSKGKWKNNKLIFGFINLTVKQLILIITLAGAVPIYIAIREYLKPDYIKFDEETAIHGELKPPPIFDVSPSKNDSASESKITYISLDPPLPRASLPDTTKVFKGIHIIDFDPSLAIYTEFGGITYPIPPSAFYQGVDLLKTFGFHCSNAEVTLGLKKDRLFISTNFRRLANEELMGEIEFNKWTLYKANILPPKFNDTMLEVKDKEGFIAFAIKYGDIPKLKPSGEHFKGVLVQGYFLGDSGVAIVNTHLDEVIRGASQVQCVLKLEKNWKQKAIASVSKLNSVWKLEYD